MLYASLKTLHLLALIVWLGGMVFVHFFLRPALGALEAPVRLRLMHDVVGRFFRAVLLACVGVLGRGGWMMARAALVAQARIAAGDSDPFFPAKIATAYFYADHVMAAVAGLA